MHTASYGPTLHTRPETQTANLWLLKTLAVDTRSTRGNRRFPLCIHGDMCLLVNEPLAYH